MKVLDSTVGMKTVEMNVVVVNVVGIPPLVPPTHQHSSHSSYKQILLPAALHCSMTLQNIDIITIYT